MNPGQEKFFNFLMERVQEELKDDAKAIMEENFKRQADGTFTPEFLTQTQAKLIKMLKPEFVDEVNAAMAHFASQIKK